MGMNYFIHRFTGLPYPPATATTDFIYPSNDKSLQTSILSAGTFFGAIIAGDVADFIGRRTTICSGCLVFIIGVIVEISAVTTGVLAAGRFIAGLGVGFESSMQVDLFLAIS